MKRATKRTSVDAGLTEDDFALLDEALDTHENEQLPGEEPDEGKLRDVENVHELVRARSTAPLDWTALYVLTEALDSHEYWALSDPEFRDSGFVHGIGSRDAGARAQIKETRKLHRRLETMLRRTPRAVAS